MEPADLTTAAERTDAMSDPIKPDVLASLAAKLAQLELTADEHQQLEALLGCAAAADAEVEGFGVVYEIETNAGRALQPMSLADPGSDVWMRKIAAATGVDLSQLPEVWTDMRP